MVVTCSQCNSNGLAFLERMYIRVALFFIRTKGGDVSVFPIEVVQPTGCRSRPGRKCFFFYSFSTCFISFCCIYFQSFSQGICYGGYGMVGIHTACVTGHFGESRHPHISHLFSHKQIRGNDVLFFFLVNQGTERMGCTIGVPNPVVGIERSTIIIMYFTIESTEIATVFTHANRAFESTIE